MNINIKNNISYQIINYFIVSFLFKDLIFITLSLRSFRKNIKNPKLINKLKSLDKKLTKLINYLGYERSYTFENIFQNRYNNLYFKYIESIEPEFNTEYIVIRNQFAYEKGFILQKKYNIKEIVLIDYSKRIYSPKNEFIEDLNRFPSFILKKYYGEGIFETGCIVDENDEMFFIIKIFNYKNNTLVLIRKRYSFIKYKIVTLEELKENYYTE